METKTMGKVTVLVTIENLSDLLNVNSGALGPEAVRRVEVDDALVDTGAKLLSVPQRLIDRLGLIPLERRRARTSAGMAETQIYRAACLTISGRRCTVDVAAVPDDCPVLVGYVPLELLDFVVDPVSETLVPSPSDSGQQVLDLF
jgi:predicted aspartyl protease